MTDIIEIATAQLTTVTGGAGPGPIKNPYAANRPGAAATAPVKGVIYDPAHGIIPSVVYEAAVKISR